MSLRLFVSNPDIIIDQLFNSMLIGHYMGLYKRPYLIEMSKEILAKEGFMAQKSEIAVIIELC